MRKQKGNAKVDGAPCPNVGRLDGPPGNQSYYPRTPNPLVVPNVLIEQPQDTYDPSCAAPYRMQDALPDGKCCQKQYVFSPRSMAQTLYNKEPNFHPQRSLTTIDNSLYAMDLSRWQTIAGTPIKITSHFKAFPRSDYRPYEYRSYADCVLPVPTLKAWCSYPVQNSSSC